MLRRIVGITGISLWAGLIAVVVFGGFQASANGEQMFENLPEGWKVERSFVVSKEQTAAISRKLGARISKLSNTYLSIQGERLQVNVLYCRTKKEAEKIHRSILKMKGDPAFCLKLDNSVVEFVGDDVELAKRAVYELGIKPGAGEAKQKQISEGDTLETMAKDLVDLLVKGDYEKAVANFDGTMTKTLPVEKLEEVWNSIIAQTGPFVEQLGVREEKILQYDVVFVTCKFKKAVLDAKVVFDRKKQISGLFFVPSQ